MVRFIRNKKMYNTYVISHKRAKNVEKIQKLVGDCIWVVGDGESQAYLDAGARYVIEGGGLCASRNKALDHAFAENHICIQISDDLSKLEIIDNEVEKTKRPASFRECADYLIESMNKNHAKLSGVAPTANAFYYQKEFNFSSFIVGDFIAVKPSPLRFDEKMRLKEDYDFTVQHLKKYSSIVRANKILASFAHRTNKGGAVDYRTSELEQQSIAYLMDKWPGWFKLNPRRNNEILMNVRG